MPILLIRHCEATGQAPDAELTLGGKKQAQILAEYLSERGIRRIVSSPYLRAVKSAEPLAEKLGITIETDPRLEERTLGKIEGSDWISPLKASFEDLDRCLPGGESTRAAMARGRAVVDEVMGTELSVAVFTHGNLLALIAKSIDDAHGFEFWRGLTNPDIFELRKEQEQLRLERRPFQNS